MPITVSDIEQKLWRGKHQLTVNQPIEMWVVTGSKPSNAYYGSARLHTPVANKTTIKPGSTLWTRNGEIYIDSNCSKKAVWSNPDDTSPFERSSGLGPYYAIAQKINSGILSFTQTMNQDSVKQKAARLVKQVLETKATDAGESPQGSEETDWEGDWGIIFGTEELRNRAVNVLRKHFRYDFFRKYITTDLMDTAIMTANQAVTKKVADVLSKNGIKFELNVDFDNNEQQS